ADGEQVDTATVEADENGEWTHTFEDLPKFKDGAEISYTVEEAAVDGYTTTIEEVDASADDATGDTEGDAASDENLDNDKIEEPDAVEPIEFAVTNTHVPDTVDIGVTKAWDDADDQDGVRPDSITVNLLADGEQVDTATVKADENGAWAYTFAGRSKYQAGAQGVEIAYTVEEAAVEGYAMAISGSAAEGFTITNTHAAQTVDIGVTKTWDDADDQDGVRPDSITVNLLADGEQVDTATIEADENGAWTHTFEGLPKLKDGNEISYTIEEVNVAGYSSTVSGSAAEGFAIANTHATETVDIDVIKIWDDADDQDGMRPDSITLKLLADGEQVGAATVTPDENGVWSCTFSNLPKYSNGSEIAYTIVEDAVEGYATTVAGPAEAVCVVLNAHAPAVVDVEVSKRWEDANNQDGKRPAKVEVALVADGERTDKTAVLDADTNWSHTFTGLPKYKDGKEIVYTALETSVPDGYAATYDGTLVTNTHEVEKVSIPVAKVWDDSNNADAIRPESVSVQLLADGKVSGSPIELSEANNWAAAFANLDKYASGTEIAYSIAEVDVPEGYTSAISGTAEAGFVVTNTHVVEQAPEPELTQVSATKVWVDQNDADGLRPESVTSALLATGEEVARQSVTAAGGWRTTIANVPTNADDGVTEIAYSVDEVAVPEGYTKTVDGTTITNTHEVARPVPGAATCSIEVLKRLAGTGVYIHEGDFTFELRDSQGALVGTAKAAHGAATGSVKFEALTFDEAGDYTYTVTESLDGTTESDGLHYKAGVLYDTRTITFTVHVEVDAATGNLVATLSSDYTGEGGPTFENTYDEKWVVIDGNEMHYNDSRREESSSGSSSEPSSEPSSEASSADSSTSASSGGSRSTNTTSTVPTTRPASTAASTTTARTGDESPLGVLAVMMLLSGGVLVYVRRRRMGN
ncbi:MAG: Cna B-type domain-containing protein, partial [Eggerthellaceae bacterium]|nr:Cna B-type domain-containing protein [Eggerthellaceae bacterium]